MKDLETWKEIYRLAGELYLLKSWKYMEETDVFGVKSPVTGKVYFISIMGSTGRVSAVGLLKADIKVSLVRSIRSFEQAYEKVARDFSRNA